MNEITILDSVKNALLCNAADFTRSTTNIDRVICLGGLIVNNIENATFLISFKKPHRSIHIALSLGARQYSPYPYKYIYIYMYIYIFIYRGSVTYRTLTSTYCGVQAKYGSVFVKQHLLSLCAIIDTLSQ